MTEPEITERPILFRPELVKAILDGRKTQTRRLVNLDRIRVRLPRLVMYPARGSNKRDANPGSYRRVDLQVPWKREGARRRPRGRVPGDVLENAETFGVRAR